MRPTDSLCQPSPRGVTDDRTASPRRTRARSLDELVAVTLLRYCRYVDPVTCKPCSPEDMITRLATQRASAAHLVSARLRQHASWPGRKLGHVTAVGQDADRVRAVVEEAAEALMGGGRPEGGRRT